MPLLAGHRETKPTRSWTLSSAYVREFRGKKPVVLFVEDHPIGRYMLSERLSEAGFEVVECETGEDALALLDRRAEVSALLTDLRLPGRIDGWDIAEAARERRPDLPVVYVSAYSYVTPRQVPGSIMLDKPTAPEEIIDALKSLLG